VKEILRFSLFGGVYAGVMLCGVVTLLHCVNSWGWSWRMGYLGRQLRERCLPSDVEKGDEEMRE
jgi:hypothetical protein